MSRSKSENLSILIEDTIGQISNIFQRPLTKKENSYTMLLISGMDLSIFKGFAYDQILSALSKTIARKIMEFNDQLTNSTANSTAKSTAKSTANPTAKSTANPTAKSTNKPATMTDYFKEELATGDNVEYRTSAFGQSENPSNTQPPTQQSINITSLLGLTTIKDLQNIFNPAANYERNYIVLDSRYRSTALSSSSSNTRFQWQYSPTDNVREGTVNSIGNIENIVSMKLYQPIIPNVAGINTNSGRISLLVEEFAAQSFIASALRKYHYIMRIALPYFSSRFVECQTEDYGDGVYNFKKPILTFDTLTVSFGDPLSLISIPNDRDKCTVNSYGLTTQVTCTIPHNLSTGDIIFLSTFTTDAPAIDKTTIDEMNNPFGLAVTVISPTILQLPVDSSTVTTKAALTMPIYYGAFRFILAFEFTYIKN